MRPGSLALQMGVILFGMAFAKFAWDRHLIEGPPDEKLVPVQARLLSAECEVKRVGSPGGAQSSVYGEPVVRYEYALGGQIHRGSRYQRQRSSAVGSMAECRELLEGLRSQPFVQAWVDPDRPEFAILSKRLRDETLSRFGMGVGAALAMFGLYRLLRSRWAR
jgi:hypothetical protein